MNRYEDDEKSIRRAVSSARDSEEAISDGTARAIAALFYGDADTYSFLSSGYFTGDVDELMAAFKKDITTSDLRLWKEPLDALEDYLAERLYNGEVNEKIDGWDEGWVPKHIDYPHDNGQLHDCWCYDGE